MQDYIDMIIIATITIIILYNKGHNFLQAVLFLAFYLHPNQHKTYAFENRMNCIQNGKPFNEKQ